jgi:hypothetical protein
MGSVGQICCAGWNPNQTKWILQWWLLRLNPQSIEWCVEGKAILRLYDSAPRPPPPRPSVCSIGDGRGRGRGWALSRIIRQQESLPLYKSFSTLWLNQRGQSTALPLRRKKEKNCFLKICLHLHNRPLSSTYKVRTLYKICNNFSMLFMARSQYVYINICTVLANTKYAGKFSKNKNRYNVDKYYTDTGLQIYSHGAVQHTL